MWVWLGLGMCLVMGVGGCSGTGEGAGAGEGEGAGEGAGAGAGDLRFVRVEAAREAVVGVLPAEVVLPSEASMMLAPPLAGRIVAWLVGVGTVVEAETPLATIEALDVGDLVASLEEMKRVLAARERTLALEKRAAAAGLASATEVAAREVEVAEARARRDAVQAQLALRGKAMRGDRGDGGVGASFAWSSPARGIVERVECPVGQVARPEAGCLVVIDPSRAVVRVHVPEAWLRRWPEGVPMSGELVAVGERLPLALTEVRRAPRLEPTSRTLAVDFTTERPLEAGRSGRVALSAAVDGGRVVPAAAVTRLEGREVVFARRGDAAVPVPIERLGRAEGGPIVRALESAHGEVLDEVVVEGLFRLKSLHVLGSGSP